MDGGNIEGGRRWDAAKTTTQVQTVGPGFVSYFTIIGACAQVTISNDRNFSPSRTPYQMSSLSRGECRVVREHKFAEIAQMYAIQASPQGVMVLQAAPGAPV